MEQTNATQGSFYRYLRPVQRAAPLFLTHKLGLNFLGMIPDRRMMSIQAQMGGRPRQKGLRMMRKTSLILLGAAAGAAMTLFATQPHMTFAGSSAKAAAAVADTYRS